ncbi:hypothetical protein HGB13_00545 [bacterium]|nr:hypothetical protein [bacterium]
MKRIQPKNKTAKRQKPRASVKSNKAQKKQRREKWEVHKFKKKASFNDYHHLTPKSRGGKTTFENMFRLNAYRHDSYHLLFGNKTLEEVIALLQRIKKIKDAHALFPTP